MPCVLDSRMLKWEMCNGHEEYARITYSQMVTARHCIHVQFSHSSPYNSSPFQSIPSLLKSSQVHYNVSVIQFKSFKSFHDGPISYLKFLGTWIKYGRFKSNPIELWPSLEQALGPQVYIKLRFFGYNILFIHRHELNLNLAYFKFKCLARLSRVPNFRSVWRIGKLVKNSIKGVETDRQPNIGHDEFNKSFIKKTHLHRKINFSVVKKADF